MLGQQPGEERRGDSADGKAGDDGEERQRQHLDEIDLEDEPAGGAEAFQGRDRRDLAGEIGAHRVADADPADQQRGETGERQEERDAIEEALHRGRRVAEFADAPAGIGIERFELADPGMEVGPGREAQAIVVIDERARLDEAGGGERPIGDHDAGAEGEAGAARIGLALHRGAEREFGVADADEIAELEAEPLEEKRIDRGAPMPVAAREKIVQRHLRFPRGLQRGGAVERVGLVDRLQLDQRPLLAVDAARHRPHRGDRRELAARLEMPALLLARLAVDEAQLDIAAE